MRKFTVHSSQFTAQNGLAVKLTNVSKRYTIHHEKPTLVEHLINGKQEEFWALKNINFEIKKGEKVGIIGPNGSGKTTLLKIISGITSSTSGNVETNGKIVSLIDLEAGFHPDLSGIDNVFLNGILLGMRKKEIQGKLTDIINFADIGNFIDAPLFTYSTGMKLRLGFAVAVHANPDILILDESLAVGDVDFQQKAQKKLNQFFTQGKTILLVSHIYDQIRLMCNKVIKLHHGRIIKKGGIELLS